MQNVARTLIAAVTMWLVFMAFATGMVKWTRSTTYQADSWVSQEELLSLSRYHGTDALKITEFEVSIWRNEKWVPVLKNENI
jgi:hypothetical protein